jgi:hypothetical protein
MNQRFGATGLLLLNMACWIAAIHPINAAAQTPHPDQAGAPQSADPLAGSLLYDDVKHYETFGVHRYGSVGANAALDWIAGQLLAAGLNVEEQRFSMDRQYFLDSATMAIAGKTISVLPQWWIPEDRASFELSAPIARDGDATGKFVRLHLPYDQGAYLNKNHLAALAGALDRKPAAVLLTIGHPSGEIFTYNFAQSDASWPVPVILVAPNDESLLDAAEQAGASLAVSIKGRYETNVAGRNVIGRLDRGKDRTIVVSTPVTSWFTSTCERGPGIAAFLATASFAARSLPDANFIFVATSGHEIGHGGMEYFIRDKAPKPGSAVAWLHYGASLACYRRMRDGDHWVTVPEVDARLRFLGVSESLASATEIPFKDAQVTRLIGEKAATGELRDVHGAGYADYLGMFGLHPLFHTPIDGAEMTGPMVLEPVVRAFAATLNAIVGKQPHPR